MNAYVFSKNSKKTVKNVVFLNLFSKTEAGHVLKMFLQFWLISASRSYKLGSYKKKRVLTMQSV